MPKLKSAKRRFQWVTIKALEQHPTIQRKVRKSHVRKIKESFNPNAMDPISVVTGDNGEFLVFNGGHRVEAVRELYGENTQIPAFVYDSLTDSEEAEVSYQSNVTRLAWSPVERFRLGLRRHDKETVLINEIIENHGLAVGPVPLPNTLACVTAMTRVYRKYGGEVLDRTLDTAIKAWGRSADTYNGNLLEGVAMVTTLMDSVSDAAFTGKMASLGAARQVEGMGNQMGKAMMRGRAYGIAVVAARKFNSRRGKASRVDETLIS